MSLSDEEVSQFCSSWKRNSDREAAERASQNEAYQEAFGADGEDFTLEKQFKLRCQASPAHQSDPFPRQPCTLWELFAKEHATLQQQVLEHFIKDPTLIINLLHQGGLDLVSKNKDDDPKTNKIHKILTKAAAEHKADKILSKTNNKLFTQMFFMSLKPRVDIYTLLHKHNVAVVVGIGVVLLRPYTQHISSNPPAFYQTVDKDGVGGGWSLDPDA